MLDLIRADWLILKNHLESQIQQDLDALKNPKTDHGMSQFYRGRIDHAEELLREHNLPEESGE